jgi:O-antigen/teichoic acid export membrane protein
MIVGIQFVSPFLITKMYGDSYIYSANVLRILCVLLLISPIGYLLGSRVLLVSGHEKLMLIAVGSGAVVNVIGNGVLIPYLNEVGAALASVMSELVVMVIYVSLGKKVYKLKSFIPTLIKIIIASAIMAAYLFGISYLPINEWLIFAIQFIGAVLIYFGCLLLTRESIVYGTINNFMRRLKKNGRVDTEGNSGK